MINIDSRLLSELDANELLLLSFLTSKTNEDRVCWYGNKTICRELRWSMVRLQSTKKRLVEKGLLEVEQRFRDNSPAQTSNYYRVVTPLAKNYTPISKLGRGDTSKLDMGGVSSLGTGDASKLDSPPTSKLGNEVLNNEELKTEVLGTEELNREDRYFSFCRRVVFEALTSCLFPEYCDYDHIAYFDNKLSDIQDPTVRTQVEKLLGAAEKIYAAFVELKRPLPEWRATSGFPGTCAGEIDPRREAIDQIKAYTDYCRLTKTFTLTDPLRAPEKIIAVDWCKKLKDYVEPLIEQEKYDPACDDELSSYWLVEMYYWQPLDVYVCKRYNNRIVFGGEEYLHFKK